MATDVYKDFVFTRNTTTVAATDLQISVEDVSLFPSNALLAKSQFFIAFESTLSYPPTFEIMQLTSVNVASKTLNVIRAQGGTTAVSHAIVTYIKGTLTSDMLRRARYGFSGTVAPAPDSDLFGVGDRLYHPTEGRYYAFTGQPGYLKDTFTRAASATTMGNTEQQTVTAASAGLSVLTGQSTTITVPYTAPWIPILGVFGINASNQAYYVSGGAGSLQAVNTGGVNMDFQFDVFNTNNAGSDYGLHFRTDITGYYGYYLQFLGTTATLYRNNNNVFTSTAVTTTYTANAVHTWRVTCNGNVITVYRDGTSVMTYTEVTAGFVTGSAVLYGSNVGFRIGNATATTDTTIYFDNFFCTTVGNTGLNNPLPQGWAPTSDIPGYGGATSQTSFLATQLASVENAVDSTVAQVDDITDVLALNERTLTKAELDLSAVYATIDDYLPVIQEHDGHLVDLANTDAVIATQVDELLNILASSSTTSGSGPPSSTVNANSLYLDTFTKRIYGYVSGAWIPLTYSGPNPTIAVLSERLPASSANNASAVPLPTGSAAGDLCVWAQGQRNGGPQYITPPSGFTAQAQGYGPYQYWSSWLVATKVLTAADITTGSITGSSSSEDATVVRVFTQGGYDVASSGAGNAGYPNMFQTGGGYVATAGPVTTTSPGDIVISMFFNVGTSPTFASPSVTLSNLASVTGSTVAIYTGDEVVSATGATTARTITANGSALEVGASQLAIKVAGAAPVFSPLANPTASKTAAYTASSGDFVLCNATTTAFTVTLPVATNGTTVLVKKTDASVNVVTVAAAGSAVIDGASTFLLSKQYDAVTLLADGTNWWLV